MINGWSSNFSNNKVSIKIDEYHTYIIGKNGPVIKCNIDKKISFKSIKPELVNKIEPISNEIKKLLGDKSYLDKILLDGVEKANMIASKKIERIKEIVGF